MTQACFRFAEIFLSTDPSSGIPQMTVQQGADGLRQAAQTAQSAAALDRQWTTGAHALAALADAMSTTDSGKMRTALPQVQTLCNPLILSVRNSTTTTP